MPNQRDADSISHLQRDLNNKVHKIHVLTAAITQIMHRAQARMPYPIIVADCEEALGIRK